MPPPAPAFLKPEELREVVRRAPLVSVDLLIRNDRDEVLLGLRANEPARGSYFVPGGMIRKNEPIADAFARVLSAETGFAVAFADARLRGAYEHFYDTNRFGDESFGTHYVVLGYELRIAAGHEPRRDAQHSDLRWWDVPKLLASPQVHDNTKAYFRMTLR